MSIWEQNESIGAALHQCVPHPRAIKPDCWEFTLVNGKPFSVKARIENDWMVLETHDTDVKPGNWWWLLELNARLGAGTRFLMRPQTHDVTLRTEVLLFEEIDLAKRLSGMRDDLAKGMALFHQQNRSNNGATRDAQPLSADSSDKSLKGLCEKSGWPGNDRDATGVMVQLEADRAFHQANVARDGEGRLHLSWEFQPFARAGRPIDAASEDLCATAVSRFLLEISGLLKMVRAEAVDLETKSETEPAEPGLNLRFSALLAPDADVAELHEAFANLSMACDLTASETESLGDSRVAARYLNLRVNDESLKLKT